MMVDVAKDRVEEIEEVIKLRHAEADIQGTDPTIPAFPRRRVMSSGAIAMTRSAMMYGPI
jgi:hypothetical protein